MTKAFENFCKVWNFVIIEETDCITRDFHHYWKMPHWCDSFGPGEGRRQMADICEEYKKEMGRDLTELEYETFQNYYGELS